MKEINWFGVLPTQNRPEIIQERVKISDTEKQIMLNYGEEYYDGDSPFSYGGYYYDGRFEPVVEKMINYYGLDSSSRILDIGGGKNYFLYEFYKKGIEDVHGIEISDYAVRNSHKEIMKNCVVGTGSDLSRWPNNHFDLVVAKDVLHNIPPNEVDHAIQEMVRVNRKTGAMFVQLGSYKTKQQLECLKAWIITIKSVYSCDMWLEKFHNNKYDGDYYFLNHDYEVL